MGAAESTEARQQVETEEVANNDLTTFKSGANVVEGEKVGFHVLAVS